jgi:hypothetical protein
MQKRNLLGVQKKHFFGCSVFREGTLCNFVNQLKLVSAHAMKISRRMHETRGNYHV